MNEKLPHVINLVLGDYSHDGHSQTDVVTIFCNLDKKALERAYKKGSKKVGFDLTDEICADYEDMSVDVETIAKIRAAGIKVEDFIEEPDDDSWSFQYDTGAFAALWMQIARLGNPDLEYEVIDVDINVGGYGLFAG